MSAVVAKPRAKGGLRTLAEQIADWTRHAHELLPGVSIPDPDSDGRLRFESGKTPKPDDPELKAADEKCKHNMPGGGSGMMFGPEKDQ